MRQPKGQWGTKGNYLLKDFLQSQFASGLRRELEDLQITATQFLMDCFTCQSP